MAIVASRAHFASEPSAAKSAIVFCSPSPSFLRFRIAVRKSLIAGRISDTTTRRNCSLCRARRAIAFSYSSAASVLPTKTFSSSCALLAMSLNNGNNCAPDLPNKSIASAALPGPLSLNSDSFLATSIVISPASRILPCASLALMPRNSSALPAPFVSSSDPDNPLLSLISADSMPSNACPLILA